MSGCHSGGGSDKVEAANDAESTGGPRDYASDTNATDLVGFVRDKNQAGKLENVPISHHTGAQLMAFPFQTMAPTKSVKRARSVQIMNMHVPTFAASKCQYRGTIEMIIPIPENIKYSMLETIISACWVS